MDLEKTNNYGLYEQSKKRKRYVFFAIIIILFLGIGYAFLQASLNISGTTNVKDNNWDVHWDNIQINVNSVTTTASPNIAATMSPSPSTLSDQTSITFNVTLDQPGDFYEFTVDAVNAGSLDAMIENISKTVYINNKLYVNPPAYLDYTVTYDDDLPLAPTQELKAGEQQTYKVRVAYQSSEELPTESQTFTLNYNVTYSQANASASHVLNRVYLASPTLLGIGEAIPTTGQNPPTQYNNYKNLLLDKQEPVFMRYKMDSDLINQAYIGLEKDGHIYYINTTSDYLEQTKNSFSNIFGQENCSTVMQNENGIIYECTVAGSGNDEYDWYAQLIKYSGYYYVMITSDAVFNDSDLVGGYTCAYCNQKSACVDMTTDTQTIIDFNTYCPVIDELFS